MAHNIKISAHANDTLKTEGICTVTGQPYAVVAPFKGWKAWKNGELIQVALPELDANQREFLMSGTTPEEWDKMDYGSGDEYVGP